MTYPSGPDSPNWQGGKSKHPLYMTWLNMRQRCNNPNRPDYVWYGARGIKVCERWESDFWNFVADMGERPPGLTLDRIDNELGYTPENCHWETVSNQMKNRRRLAYAGVLRGEKQTLSKLTADQVREIRSFVAAGGVQRRMAEKFNVSPSAISLVVKRVLWPHIESENQS